MKRWIALLLTLILISIPAPVHAQQVQFASLEVDLWPEYDRQELLVIYRVTLSDSAGLPAKLSLRIPVAAGEPFNVAIKDPADGLLYVVDYTMLEEGNWARVNFTTSSREVQIEYYDPSITFDGDTRSVEYIWPGDYTVGDLSIVVQQPINASNMRLTPSLGDGQVSGQDGLTYFHQEVGKVNSGDSFRIQISYTKPDDVLSANQLPVSPAQPLDQPGTRQVTPTDVLGINRNALIWVAMIVGAALLIGAVIWLLRPGLLIGAVIWLLRSGRTNQKKDKRHETRREAVYCTECGKRAQGDDVYCRTCGTRLRGR
jgi:hypothetical protein